MPRLVKGGKWIFGWSKVSDEGKLVIPPVTLQEYEFSEGDEVVLISGSKTSGGFSITKFSRLRDSKLSAMVDKLPELNDPYTPGTGAIRDRNRVFYRTNVRKGGSLHLTAAILSEYGIRTRDMLLVARGSGLAAGFLVRGPIVKEALRHPELDIF